MTTSSASNVLRTNCQAYVLPFCELPITHRAIYWRECDCWDNVKVFCATHGAMVEEQWMFPNNLGGCDECGTHVALALMEEL